MRSVSFVFWLLAAQVGHVHAKTLAEVCTVDYVTSSLPSNDFYQGITVNSTSVTATAVSNTTTQSSDFFPGGTISYCDVQFAYSHNGRNDQVLLRYWLPAPTDFKNRFLATGGAGYAINSGTSSLPAGPLYGASSGITDGGFGGFNVQVDAAFLLANGTVDWQVEHMWGYQAIHEMTVLGKELTKNFYATADEKIYAYYQGCSEGGREGWSQIQRFTDWDGAAVGAPAFRLGFLQVDHLTSPVVEQTVGYYPSPCELAEIVTLTIAACDPLDGKTDGVISRSDLCKLNFNITSTIGSPYSCSKSSGSPAQNGTISAEAVEVASIILEGLKDSQGRQVYLPHQPGTDFSDAETEYNSETGEYEYTIESLGGEWVAKFLELKNVSNLDTLQNVTYDTLRDWIEYGWQTYEDSAHTTWPDLSHYQQAGGKVIHIHGEQDPAIATGSSVHYYESVRNVMFPEQSYNDSTASLQEFWRLYIVPGAGHCGPNTEQPNGPFPQNTLDQLIDWVENDIAPETLNATVLQGDNEGEVQQLCAWPLRPLWSNNGTTMNCVYDQESIDTWIWDFDSFNLPVY